MATFVNFSNVLPNPSNGIAYDGSSTSGNSGFSTGPGYSSVKVDAKFQTLQDKTNSGVLVSRSKAAQGWDISISYNPLTEAEFSPVYSFLLEKQGMLKPFFVPLPQYDNPQDSVLAAQSPSVVFQTTEALVFAGTTKLTIDAAGYSPASDGALRPGDMFTITDSSNSSHTKAYKITRVETNANYSQTDTQPGSNQLRIHFSPTLQKDVYENATINYINPLVKVIMKSDIISYDLKTDNLYSFSLNLQEVQ